MKENGIIRRRLSGKEADPYIGQARKILGEMKNVMQFGGIKQLSWTKDLQNGVRIVVSSIFGQDEIRILVPVKQNLISLSPKLLVETSRSVVMVGINWGANYDSAQAFIWKDDEMTGIGWLENRDWDYSSANAVSSDGLTVVGEAAYSGNYVAFYWTERGGMVSLGVPAYSIANDVSANGDVIVGNRAVSTDTFYPNKAFKWTKGAGYRDLVPARVHEFVDWNVRSAYANGVSGNGKVVVGYSGLKIFTPTYTRATAWFDSIEPTELGILSTGIDRWEGLPLTFPSNSRANAASFDGSVIVGYSEYTDYSIILGAFAFVPKQAFRWTSSGGMVGLGFLGGHNHSVATGVSDDGNVVVGYSYNLTAEDGFSDDVPFIWTQETGMVALTGVSTDSNAYAIANDGSVACGYYNSTETGYDTANYWEWNNASTSIGYLKGYIESYALDVKAINRRREYEE